jgi:hypothetical protein
MLIFETIERIRRIHELILRKATGNPDKFAEKLHLKRRQLQNILDEFRDYGARIAYDRMAETYYYENDFEILIKISIDSLSGREQELIYGGSLENNLFSAISLHRLFLAL